MDDASLSPRKPPSKMPTNMRYNCGSHGSVHDASGPSTPRRGARTLCGVTRPVHNPEVHSGSRRIDQLSSPRYRVTGGDFQSPESGFGYSPRGGRDIALEASDKVWRRAMQHPSGTSAQQQAEQERSIGRGITLPPAEKVPTAVQLLSSLQDSIKANQSPRSRLAATSSHDGSGIAGLLLSRSGNREDGAAIKGTKLQLHELTNTEVPMAHMDADSVPTRAITSGRRKDENNVSVRAPEPSAVRSLAVSGIDTSRVDNPPQAPDYFHSNTLLNRSSRHGSCRYPQTMQMSQPDRSTGQYMSSGAQFDANTRGLHNASSYILEDKLRKKATDELRISKCGWNEDAVAARAQEEIQHKKVRNDARVNAKRLARIDYERRVNAGM